ncbi:MAG TPA: putative glycoside hydrolase, partial [Acidobacteriota bacterium]|nr:putative glycoside hydrolase [Acidobacteriota bacterium]
MRQTFNQILLGVAALLFLIAADGELMRRGRVLDADTGHSLRDAIVTLNDAVGRTESDGNYQLRGDAVQLGVRAYGYERTQVPLISHQESVADVRLKPFAPKALYLSFYGIGNRTLRESALELIETTELNALVIDVKGDRGNISYTSAIPLAGRIGAQDIITIKDLDFLLRSLREKGVYTIARIVVFKDEPLASARPDLAVKLPTGAVWNDREGLSWTDPFKKEVWDYNITIAVEAAQHGFDEIQFDYLRFPDA